MTTTLRILALFLLLFLGFGAIYGALMLISDPSGGKIEWSLELLHGTPFSTFLIPGIVLLLTIGLFPVYIAVITILRKGYAPASTKTKNMKIFRKELGRFPLGIWVAFIALILISLAWIMQAYSLSNWESAVKLGLQNASFSGGAEEALQAQKDKGIAIADLLWPLPLTVIALIGILKKRVAGFIASMMTFAICVYFPLFHIFQLWSSHWETAIAAALLWAVPSLFGIAGLWVNRHLYISKAEL